MKILGTGHYVPNQIVNNHDLEKIVDTSDEWIVSRTGIKERRKVHHETTHEMAYLASKNALKEAKIDASEIDLIVVATITENQKTPAVANFVAGLLGIEDDVMSFDLNAACTGFVYALEVAASLIQQPKYRKALVIGAETLSNVLDYTDRNTCILFGDGAGAVVIEKGKETQLGYFYNTSRPDMSNTLDVGKFIKMDGRKVFLFAVEVIEKSIKKVLEDANLTLEDIDHIIPHQANERIILAVSKSMNVSMDKFVMNIASYGNTSAASIPLTLSEYKKKHSKTMSLLLVGFGGGFTYGAAIVKV
ncbi:MAG TPA: 3-oxoacyl-ACP synthase [Acholeplasmataceae bacterium]|nr:3-oxoacyl-ACP synthase [Acholeplasmataceae bacterium]